MPNITDALLESRRMGRDPYGLKTVYDKTVNRDTAVVRFQAEVEGLTDVYTATIEWDVKNGWAPTKLNLSKPHEARWHCTCEDFRFTFHPHIKQEGNHLYDFPEYIPNGRGHPRAISDYGMCKHVAALLDTLCSDKQVRRK